MKHLRFKGMLFKTAMRTQKLFMWTRSCTCIPSSPLVPRYNARILMRHFAEEEGEELTSVFVLYYCPFRGACAPSIHTRMLKEEGETGSCGWVTNTEVEDTESACACVALQSETHWSRKNGFHWGAHLFTHTWWGTFTHCTSSWLCHILFWDLLHRPMHVL